MLLYNNNITSEHIRPYGKAKGFKNKDGKFIWEKPSWVKCHCGLWHSNRYIPYCFWKQNWILSKEKNRKKAGIIIIRNNKEVWITQSYHKCWGFPKGEKEKTETIEDCAKREFLEETGMNISDVDLSSCKMISIYISDVEYIFYIYHVNDDFDIVSFPIDDVEITSCGWINIKQLDNLKLSKVVRTFFNHYIKNNLFKYFK